MRFGRDRPLEILPGAVLTRRLDVVGNRHRLPLLREVVARQERLHKPAKDVQFERHDQQHGMQQQAQQDGQLHAAAERAVVHQGQGHGGAAEQQGGDDQPSERVGIPTRIVKPQVGQQGAQREPAQDDQRHDDRPQLFINGLVLRRLQFADDAPDFCHVCVKAAFGRNRSRVTNAPGLPGGCLRSWLHERDHSQPSPVPPRRRSVAGDGKG